MVYIIGLIVSMLLTHYIQKCNNRVIKSIIQSKRKVYINMLRNSIIMMSPLICISAFRYGIGVDYFNYVNYHIPSVLHGSSIRGIDYIEPGYAFLIKVCTFLTSDTQLVFAVTAVITLLMIAMFIQEWSDEWVFSIAIFVLCYAFNQSLNIMRQYVAIAIFFYSLKYIRDKNFKKYLFCILIATSMHKIAILYLPVYFINKLNIKKRKFFFLIVSIAIYLLNKPIMAVVGRLLELFQMNTAYTSLIGKGDFSLVLLILNIVIYVLAWLSKSKGIQSNIMFDLQYVSLCISALLGVIPFGTRILYMFMPVQIAYVPFLVKSSKIKQKKLLMIGVILLYSVFYVYYVYSKNMGGTLPYNSIFSKS